MLSGGHHLPQKSLQIKQHNKLFSRVLSKESSKGEASFRVLYYGGSCGTVPFRWESQPGTPKHTFSDSSLPPLTPPPSYQCSPKLDSKTKHQKTKFFRAIFPRKPSRKNQFSPSFSSSSVSSSCSSSYSLPSTTMNQFVNRKKSLPRSKSTVHHGFDEDDYEVQGTDGSRTSISCFDVRNGSNSLNKSNKFGGQYHGIKNMKKAVLSIVSFGMA